MQSRAFCFCGAGFSLRVLVEARLNAWSGQMRKFNSGRANWDFGLNEDRRVGRVPGYPQPKPRVRQFLAVIEQ
jgi:hypothetical protein